MRRSLNQENHRILVIDDMETVRCDFRKILTPEVPNPQIACDDALLFGTAPSQQPPRRTFDVDTVTMGETGLKYVQAAVKQQRPYSVAFVDMRMPPGWDGITTIEQLWLADPDLQIVICTAYSDHTWTDIVNRLGEGDQLLIVKKPFDAIEISQAALALSSKWSMTQEARQKVVNLESTVRERTRDIQSAHEATINCLSAASMYRDKETGAHIRRTGLYCEALARGLGWTESEVDAIRMTAPMHDVGKIGIPDAILMKPGPLTTEEHRIMETHTVIGARLLSQAASTTLHRASEIALNHHERWDGGGYPRGLSGTDIPLPARLLSIVDAFDAMSNDRVYRPAMLDADVLQNLIDGRGTQFDPTVLDVFLTLLPEMQSIGKCNPDELLTDRSRYEDILGHMWPAAEMLRAAHNECTAEPLLTSIID